MRFSCEKNALNEAVSVCSHAVGTKGTSPVMEGLLLEAGGTLTITGFNYKTAIQKNFEADVAQPGSVVLNARILADIVRRLPSETVEITVDDRLMATIRGGASEFNLIASDPQEFPELPQVDEEESFCLPSSLLREMISGTLFAVGENENKPIITGSLMEIENRVFRMVSVDGYRLAVRQEEIEVSEEERFSFVVPGESLKELFRILPDEDELCRVCPQRKHALFSFGNTRMTTRLLEGEFLNWRAAIPEQQPINIQLDRSEIISAVERVSLIISERLKNPVRCLFEGDRLKLSCTTALGRSYDECVIPDCGAKLEIGFNNRYLLDALRACQDDTFVLGLKSGLSPCTMRPVEGEKYIYLVLPVRLKAGE